MLKVKHRKTTRAEEGMDNFFFENEFNGMISLFITEKGERPFAQCAPHIQTQKEAFKRAPTFQLASFTRRIQCPFVPVGSLYPISAKKVVSLFL